METLFENKDFILKLAESDYDFVGFIETKTEKPLTFFFSEELCAHNIEDESEWDYFDYVDNIDEHQTKLLDVYEGLKEYDYNADDDYDEEQEIMWRLNADTYLRTRDDKSTGFLSNPRERGQFLALVKNYCPEKLKDIVWA